MDIHVFGIELFICKIMQHIAAEFFYVFLFIIKAQVVLFTSVNFGLMMCV